MLLQIFDDKITISREISTISARHLPACVKYTVSKRKLILNLIRDKIEKIKYVMYRVWYSIFFRLLVSIMLIISTEKEKKTNCEKQKNRCPGSIYLYHLFYRVLSVSDSFFNDFHRYQKENFIDQSGWVLKIFENKSNLRALLKASSSIRQILLAFQ